ncbi:endonuclease domain-containing 1 protein-like [Carcharodon carcharias]|uniref:endonuclease domain-containing 1 protein-like n=1 Tax=Carcharodon carcharias TaxID=13397 RepID=UPI001B7EE8C3|nr:endonuclease domain-containing 1 protein-like [Carcharodon carcharias]
MSAAAGSLLLLLFLAGPVRGEVVRDFDKCSWFFQGQIPPHLPETAHQVNICQRFKDHYHFATLYDTELRIPVYSAYRYPCSMGESEGYRPRLWFYEPQIEDSANTEEMKSCNVSSSELQAVDSDYQDESYERGHLYPFALNHNETATSTCTLTNAVPKSHEANVRWSREVELVAQKLAQTCHKSNRSMYLVTGADNPLENKIKNRVSVPGLVWTALCCTFPQDKNNDTCLKEDMIPEREDIATYDKDFSIAFMKQMEPETKAEHLTVRELENRLRAVKIFDSCRGMSQDDEAETFEEVEELIHKLVISADDQDTVEENSPPVPAEQGPAVDGDDLAPEQTDTPLEPASEAVDEGICQSTIASALAPIGRMITLVTNGASAFARLITTVVNIVRILAVTILRVPFRIIYDCANCLTIMVKYLIVMLATVPQDLLGIVASVILDTASAISWSARLIKYLVRIL